MLLPRLTSNLSFVEPSQEGLRADRGVGARSVEWELSTPRRLLATAKLKQEWSFSATPSQNNPFFSTKHGSGAKGKVLARGEKP